MAGGPIVNPERAAAWKEEWQRRHASRWSHNERGDGLIPKWQTAPAKKENGPHSEQTILAIERQINAGCQFERRATGEWQLSGPKK